MKMTSYPRVDPEYAQAMGWSRGDLNQLNAPLDSLAGKSQPADPYNHARVQHALDIIEQNPGVSAQMMQQIMSEALGPAQAQIDQRAQTRADIPAGLTALAQSGVPLEGAEAFVGANYPGMADKPFVGNALDSLYGGEQTSPLATPSTAEAPPLTAEDFTAMETDVKEMATGNVKQEGSGLPYGLHEAMMHIISKLRASGYSEESIQQAQAFVTQRWQEYGGPARPSG